MKKLQILGTGCARCNQLAAAIGYLARNSHSRMAQLAAGLLYALGRAVAYTLVGALTAWGLLSGPSSRTSCNNTSAS